MGALAAWESLAMAPPAFGWIAERCEIARKFRRIRFFGGLDVARSKLFGVCCLDPQGRLTEISEDATAPNAIPLVLELHATVYFVLFYAFGQNSENQTIKDKKYWVDKLRLSRPLQ